MAINLRLGMQWSLRDKESKEKEDRVSQTCYVLVFANDRSLSLQAGTPFTLQDNEDVIQNLTIWSASKDRSACDTLSAAMADLFRIVVSTLSAFHP